MIDQTLAEYEPRSPLLARDRVEASAARRLVYRQQAT
jgi:hypothetical protein